MNLYVDGTTVINMAHIVRIFASYQGSTVRIVGETLTGREVTIAKLEVDTTRMRCCGEIDAALKTAAQQYIERMVHLMETKKTG